MCLIGVVCLFAGRVPDAHRFKSKFSVSLDYKSSNMVCHTVFSVFSISYVFVIVFAICESRLSPVYQNQFAVHIPQGNVSADEIASKHGFKNLGQVSFFKFLFNIVSLSLVLVLRGN